MKITFKRWSASHVEKAWSVYLILPLRWLFTISLARRIP